jgi:A/G-specific adenine glycosylase
MAERALNLSVSPYGNVKEFRERLLRWGKKNFQDYPWRHTDDPYKILLAEILLHRTRAKQVVPLYENMVKNFPTVKDLSRASTSKLQEILHSAGLHWRNKLLKNMARDIVIKHGGEIPRDRQNLHSLPGVSNYITSAVRCFAFDYPEPILDTNTVRVVGRLTGITVTDSSRRSKKFLEIMRGLVDPEDPKDFNYALLDLAQLICTKRQPLCHICPVKDFCKYRNGMIKNA